jgi:rubrerythrin
LSWTLDEIPWDRFDCRRVDPEIVKLVKAASLVEYNGAAYAHHLCRIFDDDHHFQEGARRWGAEEIRHGNALARWAKLADPEFDFEAAFERFQAGYQVDFDYATSRRGSRSGEMIARCMVEVGTSSYYTALRDAVREPVLKEICRHIAADEIRHYKLFYKNLTRCLERERIGLWRRAWVAARRIAESEDDELAYAYYAANESTRSYDRDRYRRAYARRAYAICRECHVAHGVRLIFKAVGLSPHGPLARITSRLIWPMMRHRATRLAKAAA